MAVPGRVLAKGQLVISLTLISSIDPSLMAQIIGKRSGKPSIDHNQSVNRLEMMIMEHNSVKPFYSPNLSLSPSNNHPIMPRSSSAEHLLPWMAIWHYGE